LSQAHLQETEDALADEEKKYDVLMVTPIPPWKMEE
jgi:hypothetical protein